MANYYATARTNYVRFKDEAALREALALADKFNVSYYHDQPQEPLCAMFYGDDGGFCFYDPDTDDDGDWYEIAKLMADDQVLVVLEAGAEKLRYISAHASAWNNKGECVGLSLNEIYDRAEEAWGISPTPAEYSTLPGA